MKNIPWHFILIIVIAVISWLTSTIKKYGNEKRKREQRARQGYGQTALDADRRAGGESMGESLEDIAARRRAELKRRAAGAQRPASTAPSFDASPRRELPSAMADHRSSAATRRPAPVADSRLGDSARRSRDQALRQRLAHEQEKARQASLAIDRGGETVHSRLVEEDRGHLKTQATATLVPHRAVVLTAKAMRGVDRLAWRRALAMREVLDRPLSMRGNHA